jgi:hypothetical protein
MLSNVNHFLKNKIEYFRQLYRRKSGSMAKANKKNMTITAEMAYDYVKQFLTQLDEDLVEKWQEEEATFKALFEEKPKVKRNCSAYNFFCKEQRTRLKEENPDINEADLKVEISALWKEMKDNGGDERYKEQAAEDKKRYESEKAASGDESDGKKKKKKLKDENKPKKALSPYFLWGMDERPKIKADHPDMKATEVGVELGRRWAVFKTDERKMAKYTKAAEKEKERYQREMQSYVRPSDDELLARKPKKTRKAAVPKARKSKKKVDEEEHHSVDEEEHHSADDEAVADDESDVMPPPPVIEEVVEEVVEEEVESPPVEESPEPKKKKTKSAKKKPAKKNTAFLAYCEEMRPQLKEQNKKMPAKELTAKLKELWEDLGDDEKNYYEDKANEEEGEM